MELMRANQAAYAELETFLAKNKNVDGRKLAHYGYIVRIEGSIEGCFVLEKVDSSNSWLKQLFITQPHAAKLPVLLEAILNVAKAQDMKQVYVHSHQPVVDLLLETLQFHPQTDAAVPMEAPQAGGNWWTYQVS